MGDVTARYLLHHPYHLSIRLTPPFSFHNNLSKQRKVILPFSTNENPTTAHGTMAGGWSTSAFRWFDFDFSVRSPLMRWTGMFASYISSPRWSPRRIMGWSNPLSLSVVDDFLWGVITAFESVSIVSTLCFFFLFCGCTV